MIFLSRFLWMKDVSNPLVIIVAADAGEDLKKKPKRQIYAAVKRIICSRDCKKSVTTAFVGS